MDIKKRNPLRLPRVNTFWIEAVALRGSATLIVLPRVLIFGAFAAVICFIDWVTPPRVYLGVEVAPYEVGGAILGLLLVFRMNSGYERWWEARRLWGGIVNQSRNFVILGLTHGPRDPAWCARVVSWTTAFAYVSRANLRDDRELPRDIVERLGAEDSARLLAGGHMPSFVARELAEMLRDALDSKRLDSFAFLRLDAERSLLIDHVGACERIKKTPMPRIGSILVRRFILLYLATAPFALLHSLGHGWLTPVATILIAYPILSLDQIGIELQDPFNPRSLSHLPLGQICETIDRNLLDLLQSERETA